MPGPLPAPTAPALPLPPSQGVEAALLVHGGAGGGRLYSTSLALPPVAALTPPLLEYTRVPGGRQVSPSFSPGLLLRVVPCALSSPGKALTVLHTASYLINR